ncbi:MAG: hypothetical protein A3I77_06380 [Gammaproteobacteria bacterium RIFCSPLOWO2_02_FULL_42_14]|nr:MAG: hypothetical protein A3B71_06975 [Gammaproteobacteria bacterium RIFCSPHIGHO2_02_FULL_42_43]OGT29326.1 MAG: hypothetical protein A2624_00580 [Gammaproteobacteria bacterium RIFCSPHIGHO2_01_FULL_42_8]OGT52621.1 MAG: hypothetical protein A3E54_06575 [Gammaproteobacteria bacterium RIFCSPHIGHO2_12_FULL_41_25]OGT63219.1 MAG: hypothetical protein A3I77_06380 [Gammaproteobacteria bacterium RIFCSPLOWO2_02_FULL_42_14]OGT86720.1 MAG: hypothetical protein A3G86_05205 [Gammaproteobacteria bacterium R
MTLKTLLKVTVATTLCVASIATFAATATPGYRIFNQSSGMSAATYTTTNNPTGDCTGVTFPTPIDSNDNGTLTITSFTPGSICSTQYKSSYTGGTCLVTISYGVSGAITMYATPLSAACSAINGNTAVVLY